MGKYILNRLLWMIVIILGTSFIIFTILFFTPGDPAVIIAGGSANAADIENLRHIMGLDKSYLQQMGSFFYNTFIRFDLGTSWIYNKPVLQELLVRLPRTIIIGLPAMLLNLALGLPMGIFAATHEGKWQDSLTMGIAMIFISCPDFWVALLMILLFSAKLGWLPSYGIGGPEYYIMPIICSALGGIAVNARQTRASILGVFREDFITTARAKGQKERKVVFKHMLPNALMPIITSIGTGFARIVAGSAVIESVFSIPGVGLYLLTAINGRDYPVVRACVLFFAIFTAVSMLLVDMVYAFVDPRIKAQYSNAGKRRKI
ncbi:ABC transporter permease [Diplocloster modestus]|uniref:ABC transporter permease n=1 Tax=Diplocloster modestus TaxID=2850322 RepID=A0ABS6KB42_9FIRM|nr:ABC transporter permease [Diplocloster modestus]MBU9727739.1 ABC transporter permease [Diplocloster modestus]